MLATVSVDVAGARNNPHRPRSPHQKLWTNIPPGPLNDGRSQAHGVCNSEKGGAFGMSTKNWDRVPIDAQSIDAPLSRAAVFLVVTVESELTALTKVCLVLDGLDDLVKTVGFRDLSARLSCIVGIGCSLWDRLHFDKQPLELRPFAPIKGAVHAAPSTP